MVLLPALLLLWVAPYSSCTDRLRTKFWLLEPQMQINETMDACKQNYSDLFAIYDRDEYTTEAKRLIKTSNCSWIAANGCTWSSGDRVTFINLKRNFTVKEKCCGALTTGGEWECLNCTSEMYFMCSGYTLITKNKTWSEAQLYCKNNQSSLVSIRNETENEQVRKNGNGINSVWIGFQYNYKVVWSDAVLSDYKQDVCLAILPHRLCSKRDYPSTCAPLCYKRFIHVSKSKMSWEDALDYCNTQHNTSGLLRIESVDDQIETERELRRQKISEPVWIGLRQSRLFGFWIWSNGISVGPWTNWKEGSAPEHQTSQLCGALEKVNGTFKWTDKDCRLKSRFLCEVK